MLTQNTHTLAGHIQPVLAAAITSLPTSTALSSHTHTQTHTKQIHTLTGHTQPILAAAIAPLPTSTALPPNTSRACVCDVVVCTLGLQAHCRVDADDGAGVCAVCACVCIRSLSACMHALSVFLVRCPSFVLFFCQSLLSMCAFHCSTHTGLHRSSCSILPSFSAYVCLC